MLVYEQIVGKNKDVGDVSITQTVVAKLSEVLESIFKQGLEITHVDYTASIWDDYFTIIAEHKAYTLTVYATVPNEEEDWDGKNSQCRS